MNVNPDSSGLDTSTTFAPVRLAARIFSSNPPTVPESLVTSHDAPALRMAATFSSSVNGPWAAMRFLPSNPRANAFSVDSRVERMRATTLFL